MTLYKKGTHSSEVTVSSRVYSCSKCDYTEIATGNNPSKCPVCKADMVSISGSDTEEENNH